MIGSIRKSLGRSRMLIAITAHVCPLPSPPPPHRWPTQGPVHCLSQCLSAAVLEDMVHVQGITTWGRGRDKPCDRHMLPVIWGRHLGPPPYQVVLWCMGVSPPSPRTFPLPRLTAGPSFIQTPLFSSKDRKFARRRVWERHIRSKVFPLLCCTRQ